MRSYAWLLGGLGILLSIGFLVLSSSENTPAWAQLMGISGLLGMTIAVAVEYRNIVEALTKKQTQLDLRAGAIVASLAGVAIGINVMAHHLDQRWDLDGRSRLSLSPQTVALLSNLDTPIQMDAFVSSGSEEELLVEDLVHLLEKHTTQLTVRIIDPIRQPSLARNQEVTGNELVFIAGENESRMSLELEDQGFESAFRSAFIRVSNPDVHRVCFSDGHGEPDIDQDTDPSGFGILDLALAGLNYRTQRIELLTAGEVPADCTIFVATAVTRDWSSDELIAMRDYIARGGQVLVFPFLPDIALDENYPQSYIAQLPVEFNSSLAQFGVWVGPTAIEEYSQSHRLPETLPPTTFSIPRSGRLPHPIVDSLDGAVIAQRTAPLDAIPTDGLTIEPLLASSPSAQARELSPDTGWTSMEGPSTMWVGPPV